MRAYKFVLRLNTLSTMPHGHGLMGKEDLRTVIVCRFETIPIQYYVPASQIRL